MKAQIFKQTKKVLFLCFIISTGLLAGCPSHQGEQIDACNDQTQIQVCFTPGQNCTAMLVDTINAAQNNIKVQAYTFTSYPIAKALVNAKNSGVDVEVILDKSQFQGPYFSESKYLYQHNIKLYEDDNLNVTQNKLMIFDENSVETGSFNFTKSAQKRNAENMLIIHNPRLAAAYLANWQKRIRKCHIKKFSKLILKTSFIFR